MMSDLYIEKDVTCCIAVHCNWLIQYSQGNCLLKKTFNITAVEIAWILFNLLFFVVVLHQRVYFLMISFDSLVDLSFH